jgi:DNA polymerase-3 subunit epsilon/CBS domain-containing protein
MSMVVAGSATPLIARDALVIDCEAPTKIRAGIDPGGLPCCRDTAMAVARSRATFKPIPRQATRIHGIDEPAVSDPPTFAQIWPTLSSQIGDSVVIGHSIGYDLAVLKRECAHEGIGWQRRIAGLFARKPRSLAITLSSG